MYAHGTSTRKFYLKDPISCLTHLAGAIAAVPGGIALVMRALALPSPPHALPAAIVFGLSLLLLYSASAIYHMLDRSEQQNLLLKKIDHMMIFVLIAGTYTPICLIALPKNVGYPMLLIIWLIAVLGLFFKLFWIHAPRWLYTLIYVCMGWAVLFMMPVLLRALSKTSFAYLAAGGIFYTIGAVLYALRWPKTPWRQVGFHEIFHLFVLAGSICHYVMIYRIL